MVIDDLDVLGASSGPAKADPPLLVDADAVATNTITPELFEPVAWWHNEVIQCIGGIEDKKFAQRHPLGVLVELSDSLSLPDTFCLLVPERLQHSISITHCVMNVTRYAGTTEWQIVFVAQSLADRSAGRHLLLER